MREKTPKIVITILLIWALLVGTHLGEFWPFSIFPMFSQGGKTWNRVLVRDVTTETLPITGEAQYKEVELFGKPFALTKNVMVSQNDLSNFVSKNTDWSDKRLNSVRDFFDSQLDSKKLLLYKVSGSIKDSEMSITYQPFIYFTPDTTLFFQ